ncbi:hypothetical protein VTK73DRAFT_7303 [Phialemonium thermophilum]|uniref:Signal recognition particle subunit SRP72 n=1 Tax=Phialemonium thermophilum TaxID=223376 RepID=A0ABR3WFA4_9PEZI
MADPAISALNSLLRTASIADHDEALRLANAAIRASRAGSAEQLIAHHAKVVALLSLDRFDDALRALAAGGTALEQRCRLERAYALYKTGVLAEAEALLKEHDDQGGSAGPSRGLRHLAAQVAYRTEKFADAAALYRELAAPSQEGPRYGEENDLWINLLASYAQLEWQGNGHLVPETHRQPGYAELEAFETAYNSACALLARGDLAKAAVLFKRSRDLCEASEDLSDEEKRIELVPIIVQQAYVSARLGKIEEAVSLQKLVSLEDISDSSTKVLAWNNSLLLKEESNPFVLQRLAQSGPRVADNDRLFEYQASVLRRNKYIIELQARKFSGVVKTTSSILAHEPSAPTSTDKAILGVVRAAAVAELQTGKDALRLLVPLLDARPDDVGLLLTVIQLHVQNKNPASALSVLESFFKRIEGTPSPGSADVRYNPGLVGLAVSLYRLQGRQNAIRAELSKAAAHWEKKKDEATLPSSSSSADSLLCEAGIELLLSSHNHSDLAVAGAAFERLAAGPTTQMDPSSAKRLAAAGLVASYATRDLARAEPYLAALSPVEDLVSGISVDELLEAGIVVPSPAAGTKRPATHTENDGEAATKRLKQKEDRTTATARRRRRRRVRLPKDYDPARKPDPERWLPLRERSSYRPKGRKGKKRVAEATQGGGVRVVEQETLELVGGAGAVKVERATGHGGGAGGGGGPSGAGASGGGAGKKKKKGKK